MVDGIKLEGSARLRRTLRKAGADLGEFSSLNKQVAGIVVARARSTAPRGPDAGGHIVDTIRAGGTQRAAIVRVGTARKPYGLPLHWGWPRRNIKPQPWVSIAAQQTESTWINIYVSGMEAIVKKIEGA